MCGFSGFINNNTKSDRNNSDILQKMGTALKLRGPDEETFFQDKYLSFVFRRLSIIDVDGGTQPIWNEDKSVFVAVNGEIYNHRELKQSLNEQHTFKTASDSEIVVHLYEEYGTKLFSMLNGMFSIIIWDQKKNSLIIARDRMGIKPLYYSETKDGLIFGSELKALLMHPDCPREINWGDLDKVGTQQKQIVSSYVKNIYHFPAGHFAIHSPDTTFKPKAYWDISDYFQTDNTKTFDSKTIEKQYSNLLNDSINKRLMSDVPVGLFLSGGIDSSLIASIAAKTSKNIHCFTVVERTTYRSGDVELAKQVTKSLGLPFYPIFFDAQDIAEKFQLSDLENLICLMESPRFDPEWLFKSELHRAAKDQVPGLKVILLGQGADEFCGGYSTYLGSKWTNWDDYIQHNIAPSITLQMNTNEHIPSRFTKNLTEEAFSKENKANIYNTKMKMLTYQLQHFNLWHEDRTSSYHSIESRVPFLDHRLIELLASIPEKFHTDLFWNKKLIRKVAEDFLPDYPPKHPKVPFFVTDDVSSIDQFAVSICKNIYPSFRDKYLGNKKALFHAEKLDELYNIILKKLPQGYQSSWELIEMMSISIFEQFLIDTENFLKSKFFVKKMPLPLIKDSDWSRLIQKFDNNTINEETPWTLDSLINLPDGYEILNPLTENNDSTLLILASKNEKRIQVQIDDTHYWITMLLDEMGNHLNEPKNIKYWSDKVKKSPEELLGVVNNLINGGFIERVATL